MRFESWEQYRRKVVLPMNYRNEQPGVWVRRDDQGAELHVFLPFNFEYGQVRWKRLAKNGLRPDGSRIGE